MFSNLAGHLCLTLANILQNLCSVEHTLGTAGFLEWLSRPSTVWFILICSYILQVLGLEFICLPFGSLYLRWDLLLSPILLQSIASFESQIIQETTCIFLSQKWLFLLQILKALVRYVIAMQISVSELLLCRLPRTEPFLLQSGGNATVSSCSHLVE